MGRQRLHDRDDAAVLNDSGGLGRGCALRSNGLVVDRGVVSADERAALLAYLRKL
jgi:hypothetical protein